MEAAIHGDPKHLVFDHMLYSTDSCFCCYELLVASSDLHSVDVVRGLHKSKSKRLNLPPCWTAWLMTREMLSIIQLKRWKYNKGCLFDGSLDPGWLRCEVHDVSCGRSSQRQVRLPFRTRTLLLTKATRVLSLQIRV